MQKTELAYSAVPWYRRRWFVVLTILLFVPATIGIALSGPVYAQRKDGVYEYSREQRTLMVVVSVALLSVNLIRGVFSAG
ncbi:hypothetical protein ACTSKR_06805 [Chitinibacteraceae bacterium HSL-7]